MKTFDTIYITKEDGSVTWFSPEASQDAATAYGNDAAKVETRKVVRAEEGYVLKLGDKVLGTQIWLKDGQIPEGLMEVKEEDIEPDLTNEVTMI